MASIIKTDNIQNTCGANIINQCSTTITLGASGDSIVLGCGATATGFGRSGGVDYCTTVKTSPFTAANGSGYFVNTTCGAVTVTLPATPSAGAIIALKDYGNTWQTNAVTLCNNGSKINGICATASLSTQGQSVTLIYVDGTKGWQDINDSTSSVTGAAFIVATGGTETNSPCGDYKIHTFTADGCFSVSAVGNPAGSTTVDYLVVAGGGGAGDNTGGGGGAGGYRTSFPGGSSLSVSIQTYPVTVGGGGTGGETSQNLPTSGSNSIFSTITSAGGGYGGGGGGPVYVAASPGGSGGGGSFTGQPIGTGGTGNTPPTSPPQGNSGGNAVPSPNTSAGGGGASAQGSNAVGTQGGDGGDGSANSISGSSVYYAGGGGGSPGNNGAPGVAASGGLGGGGPSGIGSSDPNNSGVSGTANTGGGGGAGGAFWSTCFPGGGAGGSGIVVIRYKFQ
jgi:hypothetical protein